MTGGCRGVFCPGEWGELPHMGVGLKGHFSPFTESTVFQLCQSQGKISLQIFSLIISVRV